MPSQASYALEAKRQKVAEELRAFVAARARVIKSATARRKAVIRIPARTK